MLRDDVGFRQTVIHRVVTSYLDGLTLPNKHSVHLHRYALLISCLIIITCKTEVIIP